MQRYIEPKDVKRYYYMGEVEIKALDGVSFPIDNGEFVVVADPSGARKSMVLNIQG